MNLVVIVREAAAGRPCAYQHTKATKTLLIDVCDHLPPRLTKIEDQKHCRFVDADCQDGARRV
jgi:hypothetical protein